MSSVPTNIDAQGSVQTTQCALCRVSAIDTLELPWYDTPLFQTDNFVVTPSIGALLPGWLLVFPRDHRLSVSEIPLAQRAELGSLLSSVEKIVTKLYGTPAVFEHGSGSIGSPVGCGINHAHVHVVPLPFSLSALALEDDTIRWSRLHIAPNDVHNLVGDYLLVKETITTIIMAHPVNSVSQYFRRLIAARMGLENQFDYRLYPFLDNVHTTVRQISGLTRQVGSQSRRAA